MARFSIGIAVSWVCLFAGISSAQEPNTTINTRPQVSGPSSPQPDGRGEALDIIRKTANGYGAAHARERTANEIETGMAKAFRDHPEAPGVLQIVERRGIDDTSVHTVGNAIFGTQSEAMAISGMGSYSERETSVGKVTDRYGVYYSRDGQREIISRSSLEAGERVSAALRQEALKNQSEDRARETRIRNAKTATERESIRAEQQREESDRRDRQRDASRYRELLSKSENGTATEKEKNELTETVEREERKLNVGLVVQTDENIGEDPTGWDEWSIKNDPIGYLRATEAAMRNKKLDPMAPYINSRPYDSLGLDRQMSNTGLKPGGF